MRKQDKTIFILAALAVVGWWIWKQQQKPTVTILPNTSNLYSGGPSDTGPISAPIQATVLPEGDILTGQ